MCRIVVARPLIPTTCGGVNNVSSQIPRDPAPPPIFHRIQNDEMKVKTVISTVDPPPHPEIVHRARRVKAFISDALDFLR